MKKRSRTFFLILLFFLGLLFIAFLSSMNINDINSLYSVLKYDAIFVGLVVGIIFLIFYLSHSTRLSYEKKYPRIAFTINADNQCFRDIPCQNDILKTYWLCFNCLNLQRRELILGVFLLKWIFEHKITIDKDTTEIRFYNNQTFDYEYEYVLYDLLKKTSGEDGILKINEMLDWSKVHYKEIVDTLNYALKLEEETLVNNNQITYSPKTLKSLFFTFDYKQILLSEALNNDLNEIVGFKNYLREFTIMSLREVKEVHVWEKYLMFAYLTQEADTADEQLKEFIPEYTLINNFTSFFS